MEAPPKNPQIKNPPAPNLELELRPLDYTYRIQQIKAPRSMASHMAVFNIDPPALRSHYTAGSLEINDPRPVMRAVNAGQLFGAAFVVLDRIVEWLFALTGNEIPRNFAPKASKVTGLSKDNWPQILRGNTWLTEPLFALYSQFYPARNTMVHGGAPYSGQGGALTITRKSGKDEKSKETITLRPDDLREFAELVVTIYRCATGIWPLDTYQEKRLRYSLFCLAPFHGVEVCQQAWPHPFRLVAIADCDTESVIDMDLQREQIQETLGGYEPVIELWVYVIDGTLNPQVRHFSSDELRTVPSQLTLSFVLNRPPCEAPQGHRVDIAEENERYRQKIAAQHVEPNSSRDVGR